MRDEFICFYEFDWKFKRIIERTREYLDEITARFTGMVSPDCSLYRDMPTCLQIANTYLNRAIGCYFQRHGMKVIPNVRWGGELSYYGGRHLEPFAFLGVEKGCVVSIGTYGCLSTLEDRLHIQRGLEEMIRVIAPPKVLVYGNMPDDVFCNVKDAAEFIRYSDWTTLMRGGIRDGNH